MTKIQDFLKYKTEKRKISMVTAYDYTMAGIINASDIDCILVGDSLAMVMHGAPSTLSATPGLMALHTRAVSKGAPDKFIISDMPFLSFRKGIPAAMDCVEKLMRSGACAVKPEGVAGHEDVIERIANSDVPVMGHLGLTPQSVHKLGGYKIQGTGAGSARTIFKQAKKLEALGCFALVLECVPDKLAAEITASLKIPVIGIGAGPHTDGQVLVLQDMLGMYKDLSPKFVKHYLEGHSLIREALNSYNLEIKTGKFPQAREKNENNQKHKRLAKV